MQSLSNNLPNIAFLVVTSFSTSSCAAAASKQTVPPQSTVAPAMKVVTVKDQPSIAAPAENFTGSARVTMVAKGEDPSTLGCGFVEFQPRARSNWHTHPKGQLLIVTEGSGLVQEWGKPVRAIKAGDVIWTPPEVKHWHGASPNQKMAHAAVSESLDGKTVQWMERVTDGQYKSKAQ